MAHQPLLPQSGSSRDADRSYRGPEALEAASYPTFGRLLNSSVGDTPDPDESEKVHGLIEIPSYYGRGRRHTDPRRLPQADIKWT